MRIYCQRCKKEHGTVTKLISHNLYLDVPSCHPLSSEEINSAHLSRLFNEEVVEKQKIEEKLNEALDDVEFVRKENDILRKKLHSIYTVLSKISQDIE